MKPSSKTSSLVTHYTNRVLKLENEKSQLAKSNYLLEANLQMHKQLISTLAENKPLEASLLNRFVNENERLRQLIRDQSDQLTLLQNKLNNQ